MKAALVALLFLEISIAGVAQSSSYVTKIDSFSHQRLTVTSHNDETKAGIPKKIYWWDKLLIGFVAKDGDHVMDIDSVRSLPGEAEITQRIEWYGHPVKVVLLDTANSRKLETLQFMLREADALLPLDLLETKLTINGKEFSEHWQPAKALLRKNGEVEWAELFNTYYTMLKPGAEAELRIRNKDTKKILRVLQLARKDLVPYQTMQQHLDKPSQNFERSIAKRDSIQQKLDSFYAKKVEWSAYNTISDEQQLTPHSRLLWFFRHQDGDLPDSSLVYNMSANGKPVFAKPQPTGHMLLLDKLESNTHYVVTVWYAMQPENARTYRFYLPPVWYESVWMYWLLGFVAVALLIGIPTWLLRRRTRLAENKTRETGQRLASIRSQLNPHFVFNAMNSIQSLINKGEIDGANTFLNRFSKLLRTSLEPAYQGMISLQQELNLLEQYLQLEQLRIPFVYKIHAASTLDIYAIEVPGMLLQPLAENAIKHALPHSSEPTLDIYISAKEKDLVISLSNNGKPFDPTAEKGMGLQLVDEKLWIVNQHFPNTNAVCRIFTQQQKTIAEITFKNWLA